MKISRIAASGAGIALIAASAFVGSAAANAEDIDVTVPSPLPAETSPYSAGWFAGEVASGDGTAVQTAAGLTITGGTNGFQLLNGDPVNGAPISLADALDYQQVATLGADAFFQISVFGEPGAEFTTLRPVVASEPWNNWTTSQSVAGLTANEAYTKAELLAALDAGTAAEVLAYGVFVNAGTTSTVRALYFGGNTYYFAAQPTLSVNPTSLTVAQASTPVTLTGAGFAAGETVFIGIGFGNSGDSLGEVVADENGAFTFTYTFEGVTEPFTGVFFAGDTSGLFSAQADFSVVANPVVPAAAPVLPATGFDSSSVLLLGGVLLLAGAGVAVATVRRKASA